MGRKRLARHAFSKIVVFALGTCLAVVTTLVLTGCIVGAGREYSPEEKALMRLQTAGSVWWTGGGSHAVLQAVGEDGKPTVEVWDRASGKRRTYQHYRVVDVEPEAARLWVVPDSRPVPLGVNADSADPRVVDVAGDGVDSLPGELYVIDLKKGGEPRSDLDARWSPWEGSAGYAASVEIDVNKGACPSTLRFYKAGGSLNAWSAKVPTDVVTFEPLGWSPSGEHFAVISQADESTTARLADEWTKSKQVSTHPPAYRKAPGWEASVIIFKASDGSVFRRQHVRVPVLTPNAGSNLLAWGDVEDTAFFIIGSDEVLTYGTGPDGSEMYPRVAEGLAKAFLSDAAQLWFAGVDGGIPVFGRVPGSQKTPDSVEVIRLSAPDEVMTAEGAVTVRLSEKGGVLSLKAYSENEMGWVVYHAKEPGAPQREIFAVGGPIEPVRGE